MRILAYCDEDLTVAAGGARQVIELSKALAWLGHEVTVVAPEPAADGRWPSELASIRMVTIPVIRQGLLRPLSFLFRSVSMLKRLVKDRHPDVLLWFDSPGQVAPLWALRETDCPIVYFVNGLPAEEVRGLWAWRPIRQLLSYGLARGAERAEALVSVCPEILTSLRKRRSLALERCAVIRNGVDPERFHPQLHEKAKTELRLKGPGPYLSFIGGFFPWHGLDQLIDALPDISEVYPNVQVLMVGDGQTKPSLEQMVARKGLTDRVRFVGRVASESVPTWIAASDVCVVLHKPLRSYPGDSMKLWEYLACGRPVVTTVGSGYGDMVETIGCGLAARPDDPRDLARQILSLLNDPDERAAMGQRGRTSVLQSHTWLARATELEALCRRVSQRLSEPLLHVPARQVA